MDYKQVSEGFETDTVWIYVPGEREPWGLYPHEVKRVVTT